MFAWIVLLSPWLALLAYILWEARDKNLDEKHRYESALVNWTKVLGLSTVLLVGATAYSAHVLNVTDHTLRETLEASGRAWVMPKYIQLFEPIEVNRNTKVLLYFGNVGREPAINVGGDSEIKFVKIPITGRQAQPSDIGAWINDAGFGDPCIKAEKERYFGVIYPSGNPESNSSPVSSEIATKEAKEGSALIVVKGCFVYETMGKTRRSKYCFFYNSIIAVQRPPEHKNHFQPCTVGNDAT
jgi:hypothetical protein